MRVDLETMAGAPTHAQVCILGGGIAGLILAQTLAERGIDVLLLEAGGLALEERSQSLYEAEMGAAAYSGAMEGRFRTFGGSSTRWGGQMLPYTADIFRPPAGCPSLPWPIEETAIAGHYARVEQILHANALPYTADLLTALGHPVVDLTPEITLRFSKWAPFNKRNLARTVGRAVLEHAKARVVLHANVTRLEMNEGRTAVLAAHAVNYAGERFRFTADHFVAAAGTIESTRLMLLSGIGGAQAGEHFHDHIGLPAARIPAAARGAMLERLGPFFADGNLHTCKLEASAALRAREHLLAVMAHVTIEEPEDSGIAAVRNLLRSLQRGRLSEAVTRNLLPFVRGTGDVARLLYASKMRKRRAVSARAAMHLKIDLEQAPDSGNRIRLSETRDALGMPKAVVDWRVSAAEMDTVRRFARVAKARLERAGFPPLEWVDGVLEGDAMLSMADTFHAMGGLLMGDDAARGVVDADLKVRGVANLHVASCAVFPSGGSSNPTFTLMALTLRLAEHLLPRLR